MGAINWTDRQLGVINSIDGNILVSASAGSGKTAVMLERVMRLITGESGKARVPLKEDSAERRQGLFARSNRGRSACGYIHYALFLLGHNQK